MKTIPALALVLAALLLAGCGGAPESGPQPAPSGASEGTDSRLSDQLKAKLAAADKVDGAEDQVIRLCSGCQLGMSGKAEHAIQAGSYELHMCSAACKAHFEEDLEASLAALEIPQS